MAVRYTRREFLELAGVGAAGLLLAQAWPVGVLAAKGRRPNVLVILADDLGYGDLGCQGCRDIPTPNIDSIARAGVRFTDGYVSCPVCSPTRAGLMTGRYQQRFGHEFNLGGQLAAGEEYGLPLAQRTLAEWLKGEGYATGLVGKWHLGFKAEYAPTSRGFDEFFGFLGGAHRYRPSRGGAERTLLRGRERVAEKEYLTDAFTREAVAFIDRHRAEPFFLYLAYNAVHAPMQASTEREGRFAGIENPARRTFATMLAAMDDGVGAVLGRLRELGLEQDTLVFFLSDNGGPTGTTTTLNGPLRGYKAEVLEGGIRVPFLMCWPGKVPAGKAYTRPVISLDVVPTALAAAGVKVGPGAPGARQSDAGARPPTDAAGAKLDGVDLLPYVAGSRSGQPHKALFWRMGAESAVRVGEWKLVRMGAAAPALYNLKDDVGEKKDLAPLMPKKVQELEEAYARWDKENIDPVWKRARPATRRRAQQAAGAGERDRVGVAAGARARAGTELTGAG
jgi:arylsulfatase A-like enzyme